MKILATLFFLFWLIPVGIGTLALIVAQNYPQASAWYLFALLIWVVADRLG